MRSNNANMLLQQDAVDNLRWGFFLHGKCVIVTVSVCVHARPLRVLHVMHGCLDI